LPADQQVPDVERITHDEASIRRLVGRFPDLVPAQHPPDARHRPAGVPGDAAAGTTAAALAPAAGSVQADFNNDGADDLAAGYRWAERGAARNGAAAVPA
jgi:hypothetical protein